MGISCKGWSFEIWVTFMIMSVNNTFLMAILWKFKFQNACLPRMLQTLFLPNGPHHCSTSIILRNDWWFGVCLCQGMCSLGWPWSPVFRCLDSLSNAPVILRNWWRNSDECVNIMCWIYFPIAQFVGFLEACTALDSCQKICWISIWFAYMQNTRQSSGTWAELGPSCNSLAYSVYYVVLLP